jgi:hypothetical protein
MLANDIRMMSLGNGRQYYERAYNFREELAKNADKFIVYELAAFEPRVF